MINIQKHNIINSPKVVVMGYPGSGGGHTVRVHHMPLPGETVIAWDYQVHKDGGKAAHQAMVISRLGGNSAFIGKVGNDIYGDSAKQWLIEDGVNVKHLLYGEKGQMRPGLILVDDNGVNSIISIKSTGHTLTIEEVKPCIEDFKSAQIFITGFEIPFNTALEGAKLAKDMGMMTILNPAPMPNEELSILEFIDIVIPNEPEAKCLAGMNLNEVFDPLQAAIRIKEKYRVGMIIITLGGDGVFVYDGENSWKIEPITVDVINTTGAGDAFIGAFAWALSNKMEVRKAIEWGNYVAALSVTKEGTIASFPKLNEVEEFIKTTIQLKTLK